MLLGVVFLGRGSVYCVLSGSPITAHECKILQVVWTRKPVNYSFLHTFGFDAYVWVPKGKRTKLDARSERFIFLGYVDGTKGYRFWDPTAHKIVINQDVVFNEDSMQKEKLSSNT